MTSPVVDQPSPSPEERAIDDCLGLGRKPFGYGWWALAIWSSAASVNVLARAQNWGFHLPFGPGFDDVDTGFGVAAYGSFGGATLLWVVLAGMLVHGATWGRLAEHWPGRVPAAWATLSEQLLRPFPRLLQAAVVVIAILVPLAMQALFASKFLAGTGVLDQDTRTGLAHLWPPAAHACRFVYDGKRGFSYCEFYEPWAVLLCAVLSFVFAAIVLSDLPWPGNRAHRLLCRSMCWLSRRLHLTAAPLNIGEKHAAE